MEKNQLRNYLVCKSPCDIIPMHFTAFEQVKLMRKPEPTCDLLPGDDAGDRSGKLPEVPGDGPHLRKATILHQLAQRIKRSLKV